MPGTMYPIYRRWLTNRLPASSPLTINLTCTYDSVANTGTVNATVTNTSGSSVSGNLHFAVTESNIPYNWYGLTTVEHVCRDMLPDGNGESVTIPAGNNIVRSRNFTINTAWNENNVFIVVFVQGSTREIYQGAQIGIMPKPKMDYYGQTFTELSGNINRVAQPNENIRMYVKAKNNGAGTYTGGMTITESDPYITINSSTPQTISIQPGQVDTVIIANFAIASTCPVPYTANFFLNFGNYGGTDTIKFMVTNQPGFSDNIEAGQGGWTHSGGNDNWHITTYKSHSPTRSWYSGVESNYQYTNLNDASLVSPYFVVTPDSSLKFWHQYATEVDFDYSYCEIDNNMGWWQILGIYNGTQSAWTQMIYPLSAYSGQTVRLRYRFLSDQSVVAEGWYVDDILVPIVPLVVVQENKNEVKPVTLQVSPNPFTRGLKICCRPTQRAEDTALKIFDASGRLIRQWDHHTMSLSDYVNWDGTDGHGHAVPAGVYFVRFETSNEPIIEKVLKVK